MSWYIELCHNWSIIPHPTGTGIALELWRGIPCEGHVQIFTAHENTVEDIEARAREVVAANKESIEKAIDGFVNMVHGLGKLGGVGASVPWAVRDILGGAFCQTLVNWIRDEAERLDRERMARAAAEPT